MSTVESPNLYILLCFGSRADPVGFTEFYWAIINEVVAIPVLIITLEQAGVPVQERGNALD